MRESLSPLSMSLLQGRHVLVGPALPSSHPWAGSPTPTSRASSTVLHRQRAGPGLFSAAADERQGQLSCSHDPRMGLLPAASSKGKGRYLSHVRVREQSGQFPHTHTYSHTLGDSTPATPKPRACFLGLLQGLLSLALQLVGVGSAFSYHNG